MVSYARKRAPTCPVVGRQSSWPATRLAPTSRSPNTSPAEGRVPGVCNPDGTRSPMVRGGSAVHRQPGTRHERSRQVGQSCTSPHLAVDDLDCCRNPTGVEPHPTTAAPPSGAANLRAGGHRGRASPSGRAGDHRRSFEYRRPYRPCPRRALSTGQQRSATDHYGRCMCPPSRTISPYEADRGSFPS